MRIKVGGWLGRMDDPRRTVLTLDSGSDRILSAKAARVYHVNLVVRLTSLNDGKATLRKALLILSRNGIERIEM
jgi:hypothetical protein